ncbi:MAG: UrcA family protein [Sphingomonas sp.]
MKKQQGFAIALGIAIAAIAAPAIAQDQPAQAKVPVRDLDLTRSHDRMTADKRLTHAAKAACPDTGPGLQGHQNAKACSDDLVDKGTAKIGDAAMQQQAHKDAEMAAMRHDMMRHHHRMAKRRHHRHMMMHKMHHMASHPVKSMTTTSTTKAH